MWIRLALLLPLAGCPASDVEICGNGVDDDGDGLTDCQEPLCRCDDVEICVGGIDEDLDGLVDCRDDDCAGDPACTESACADGVDDDGDGLVDCADPDCDGGCPEVCDDGRDNDGDGLVDCEDEACADAEVCGERLCDDGTDDDGDGLVDCDDDDCWGLACHPDGIVSQVTGGTMRVTVRDIDRQMRTGGSYSVVGSTTTAVYPCGPGDTSVVQEITSSGVLLQIAGTLRVRVPTDSGTATETCAWGFSRAELAGEDGVLEVGPRSGFFVTDSARCRVAGTSWLPEALTRDGLILRAFGGRRYAAANPVVTRATQSSYRTTTWRASCYRYFASYTRTSSVYGVDVFGDEGTAAAR